MTNNNKVKILIVDDKKANLIALEAVLACDKYELVSAQSGEEALKYILKQEFALILLDVQMPKINGFETAKLIKQRKNSTHIPIIFITALSKANEMVEQGYLSGAVDYIFKPFNPIILKSKVDVFAQLYIKQKEIEAQRVELENQQIDLIHKQNNFEMIIEERTKELLLVNKDLQETKERFRKFFQFNPNLMAIRSLYNKRFIEVNEAWIAYTGYKLEELNQLTENPIKLVSFEDDYYDDPLDLKAKVKNKKISYING